MLIEWIVTMLILFKIPRNNFILYSHNISQLIVSPVNLHFLIHIPMLLMRFESWVRERNYVTQKWGDLISAFQFEISNLNDLPKKIAH